MREVYHSTKEAVRLNKDKGFTLIELLVVIAIIAILAAIAIPQFAQFRMRAFNSSAESDLRNLKTAEEALYADYFSYGSTQSGELPSSGTGATTTCTQNGVVLAGPLAAATTAVSGGYISGITLVQTTTGTLTGEEVAVGIGVSSNVDIRADVNQNCQNYTAVSHHNGGDTVYGVDSDSTSIYYQKSSNFVNDSKGNLPVQVPTPTSGIDFQSPWRTQ